MDRVMIHAHIYETDSHAFALPNDERSGGGTSLAVKSEPIKLHVHAVRNRAVRQNGVLLQGDQIIPIHVRCIGDFWMNDEATEHPDHLLHGHVWVVEERPVLMKRKFV